MRLLRFSGSAVTKWNRNALDNNTLWRNCAFTILEIMIVAVIISIIAMMAVPMFSSASGSQLRTAASIVAADIEYATSMAIKTSRNYSVVFNADDETYQIQDQDEQLILHPVSKKDYVVDFTSDQRLNRVEIDTVSFDSTSVIKFDYLGSPYDGNGQPITNGSVKLIVDEMSLTVSVEPVTGYISISE